jgi:hypothetical protein
MRLPLKTERYRFRARPRELLQLFTRARGEEKVYERSAGRWLGFGLFVILVGAASCQVAYHLQVSWLYIVAGCSLIPLVVAFLRWTSTGQHDLPDRELGALIGLLRALAPATRSGSNIALEVDLQAPDEGGELLVGEAPGLVTVQRSTPGEKRVQHRVYRHHWLSVRATVESCAELSFGVVRWLETTDTSISASMASSHHSQFRDTIELESHNVAALRVANLEGAAARVDEVSDRVAAKLDAEVMEVRAAVAEGSVLTLVLESPTRKTKFSGETPGGGGDDWLAGLSAAEVAQLVAAVSAALPELGLAHAG